ncbi:MAG: class I SAM-dependent methyltransferase [Candidatus Thermoplasmatota archaeon]|nr:class I SAM-dependent methyltransferase [Candidatus Thermoplasmatota archaeon]
MVENDPFSEHSERYEGWFEEHEDVYRSELRALSKKIPQEGKGVEIGVGSGRFSEPFPIDVGVDPSPEMLNLAEKKEIDVIRGVGEKLPLDSNSFDFVLIVTTICFFDKPLEALKESERILKENGNILIGFIDKDSPLGRTYQERRKDNVFYEEATFFSVEEVVTLLKWADFDDFSFVQTLFDGLDLDEVEEVKEGHGEGSFVVVKGKKSQA